MWTGGDPLGKGGTVVSHPVTRSGCAAQLRALCNATSPAQTRAMMFSLKLVLSQEEKQYNTNRAEKFKHFLHPFALYYFTPVSKSYHLTIRTPAPRTMVSSTHGDPSSLLEFEQDLANFLLIRGPVGG